LDVLVAVRTRLRSLSKSVAPARTTPVARTRAGSRRDDRAVALQHFALFIFLIEH
jgi:hypothetical protein